MKDIIEFLAFDVWLATWLKATLDRAGCAKGSFCSALCQLLGILKVTLQIVSWYWPLDKLPCWADPDTFKFWLFKERFCWFKLTRFELLVLNKIIRRIKPVRIKNPIKIKLLALDFIFILLILPFFYHH